MGSERVELEGIHEVQSSVLLQMFRNSTTGRGWEGCEMTCARGVPTSCCDVSHFSTNTSLIPSTPFLEVEGGRGPPGAERGPHTTRESCKCR